LKRFLPCSAIYPDNTSYICGQHQIFHTSHGHRTCQKVPRTEGTINRLLSEIDGGRHMLWSGVFEEPNIPSNFFEKENWETSFVEGVYQYIADDKLHGDNTFIQRTIRLDSFENQDALQSPKYTENAVR